MKSNNETARDYAAAAVKKAQTRAKRAARNAAKREALIAAFQRGGGRYYGPMDVTVCLLATPDDEREAQVWGRAPMPESDVDEMLILLDGGCVDVEALLESSSRDACADAVLKEIVDVARESREFQWLENHGY